jgi:hypothetical protein
MVVVISQSVGEDTISDAEIEADLKRLTGALLPTSH